MQILRIVPRFGESRTMFVFHRAARRRRSRVNHYNQNFAVIRETLPLDLKAGNNTVNFEGATAQVEPDSVILRDATGSRRCKFWNRVTATIRFRRSAC